MKLTGYQKSILTEKGKWWLSAIKNDESLGINPELSGKTAEEISNIKNDRQTAQLVFSSLIEILGSYLRYRIRIRTTKEIEIFSWAIGEEIFVIKE